MMSGYSVRVMVSVVILSFILTGASFFANKAEARRKKYSRKEYSEKTNPQGENYRQAPAYNKRSRKNRRLVIEARRSNRQLRRTGTAYEDN